MLTAAHGPPRLQVPGSNSKTVKPAYPFAFKPLLKFLYVHRHITIHGCIHICLYAYMRTYIRTYIHTYIHTYIQTYLRTYIHTCMHARMHKCIHTYIHAHICFVSIYVHRPLHVFMVLSTFPRLSRYINIGELHSAKLAWDLALGLLQSLGHL